LLVMLCVLFALFSVTFTVLAPLLPRFERELDLSHAKIGLLVGASSAGVVAGAIASVALLRRFGPRVVTTIGVLVVGAGSIAFGFGDNLGSLMLARIAQGVGGGVLWAGGLNWLLRATEPTDRGSMVGTVFGAETFGAIVGPGVGTLALTFGMGVFVAIGSASIVIGAIAVLMPHPAAGEVAPPVVAQRGETRVALLIIIGHAVAFSCLSTLIPLQLDDFGASGSVVGAVFVASSVLGVVGSPVMGRISDRVGRVRPIQIGCVLSAATFVVLGASPPEVVVVVATIGWIGVIARSVGVPVVAMLFDGGHDAASVAAVSAKVLIAFSVGTGLGPPVAGALSDVGGDALPFFLLAAASLVALVAVRWLVPGHVPVRTTDCATG
jgi:MFS family permease